MAFRRDTPPPFEVMRQRTPTGPLSSLKPPPPAAPQPPLPSRSGPPATGLWARSRQAVILRIPRGYLVLLAAGLILLIVLSFWTGRTSGFRHGFAQAQRQLEAALPAPMAQQSAGAPAVTPRNLSLRLVQSPPLQADPRREGLNYFIIAHYREDEAERLVEFLWQQGVEAAAFRPHNASLFQVVALRGFTATELDDAGKQYRQSILALGRLWKEKYRGSDFSRNGIYPAKYTGDAVAAMIVTAQPAPDGSSP